MISTLDNLGISHVWVNHVFYVSSFTGFIEQQLDTCQFLSSSLQKQCRGEPGKVLLSESKEDALPMPFNMFSSPAQQSSKSSKSKKELPAVASRTRRFGSNWRQVGDFMEVSWGILRYPKNDAKKWWLKSHLKSHLNPWWLGLPGYPQPIPWCDCSLWSKTLESCCIRSSSKKSAGFGDSARPFGAGGSKIHRAQQIEVMTFWTGNPEIRKCFVFVDVCYDQIYGVQLIGVSINGGYPQNGWFLSGNIGISHDHGWFIRVIPHFLSISGKPLMCFRNISSNIIGSTSCVHLSRVLWPASHSLRTLTTALVCSSSCLSECVRMQLWYYGKSTKSAWIIMNPDPSKQMNIFADWVPKNHCKLCDIPESLAAGSWRPCRRHLHRPRWQPGLVSSQIGCESSDENLVLSH